MRRPPARRPHTRVALVAVLTLALSLVACSDDDDGDDASSSTDTSPTVTTTTTTTDSTSSSSQTATTSTTTTAAPSSSEPTTTDSTPATLPGEPYEGFPRDGDRLQVVGVAHDDDLNVRAGPGVSYDILGSVDPLGELAATGDARLLDDSIWYQVTLDGEDGWVNSRFVAYGGLVDDVTSQVVDSLGGIPEAETMLDLGLLVAEDRSSTDVESRIVVVVAPTVGDLGEVTYDVLGLADDALYGVRLHVFGQPLESGEGFGLGSVEETLLCGRGVADAGRCA